MYGEPLISALERRNKRVVDSMLECDLLFKKLQIDHSLLEVAAPWCEIDLIRDLMYFGADINRGSKTTALGAAIRSRNRILVHQLLELGAQTRGYSIDSDGVTPLQAALELVIMTWPAF